METKNQPPRLHIVYQQIVDKWIKEKKTSTVMAAPRITKIVINCGLGEAVRDKKVLDSAQAEITAISGQKAVITHAKKSIAGFKIRDDYPIGCKVTLRRDRMYYFLDNLINVALPRVRDFRGLPNKSFDGRGNFSFGLREQIVFSQIKYEDVDAMRGMDVTVCTTANTDAEARDLLVAMGLPIRT